jgi:hypothetical protein
MVTIHSGLSRSNRCITEKLQTQKHVIYHFLNIREFHSIKHNVSKIYLLKCEPRFYYDLYYAASLIIYTTYEVQN